MRSVQLALASLALALAGATAAQAQEANEPKVNMVIVYGADACPESTDDTITVCARKDEGERFRIPEPLREHRSPQNESWNNRVRAYETVTRTGTNSCSAVGSGGWTGCQGQLINQAYGEKATDPSLKFAQMIADERANRLATIDQDAAETQGRVEEVERQMEERRKAREAAGDKDPQDQKAAPLPGGN